MRLRRNELCPVHKSLSCCGRELISKPRTIRLGVQRVEDPHHPRGYLGRTSYRFAHLLRQCSAQSLTLQEACPAEFPDAEAPIQKPINSDQSLAAGSSILATHTVLTPVGTHE